MRLRLYNSLTRQIEDFVPRSGREAGMYTCGPTVYDTATIANFRTYTLSDLVVRTMRHFGYEVKYVMNLTDVGHLSGDNEGDADTGVDRMEKGAKREGASAWEIAQRYSTEFVDHTKLLNLTQPDHLVKATEHIEEQIELVKKLEERGLTYKTSDGIYFDVGNYEKLGYKYGELSTLDERREGARVAKNHEKRGERDFALWKFSPTGSRRQMEWDSPWGVGFPGWHVECSAMAIKYLGERFDIHLGGEDLRSTHHPNEIAQSEGATGKKPFVKYWIHGAFLLVDGGRMGKSLGNAYTIEDVRHKGYDPLALRYFYLTGHYRKQLNFTWEALESAAKALAGIRESYWAAKQSEGTRTALSSDKLADIDAMRQGFEAAIADDFNFPVALTYLWELLKSNIPSPDKVELANTFDEVLGFDLREWKPRGRRVVPPKVGEMLERRDTLRKAGNYAEADKVRDEIEGMGYKVIDTENGSSAV